MKNAFPGDGCCGDLQAQVKVDRDWRWEGLGELLRARVIQWRMNDREQTAGAAELIRHVTDLLWQCGILVPPEILWSSETGVVRNWAHLPICQWDFPEEEAFRISLPGMPCAAHFIRTIGSEQRCPEFLPFWLSTLQLGSHYPLCGRHQNRHLTPWNGGWEAALLAWWPLQSSNPIRSFSMLSLTWLRLVSDLGSSSLLQGLSDQVSLSLAA